MNRYTVEITVPDGESYSKTIEAMDGTRARQLARESFTRVSGYEAPAHLIKVFPHQGILHIPQGCEL